MTLAQRIVSAVVRAQGRMEESKERIHGELTAKLESLRVLCEMPADLDELEQRGRQLNSEVEELEQEIKRTSLDMFGVIEESDRKLREAWQQLLKAYKAQASELRSIQVHKEFQSAIAAYDDELKNAEIEVSLATPAKILRQIPRLKRHANEIRQHAKEMALRSSKTLAEEEQFRSKETELAERKQNMAREIEEIEERLSQHGLSLQDQLISEILSADASILRQLRRDVFEPKLAQARVEREKGLAGEDPLKSL